MVAQREVFARHLVRALYYATMGSADAQPQALGAEVPDLPMPVLQHQMSHVRRRPYSKSVPDPAKPERPTESAGSATGHQDA